MRRFFAFLVAIFAHACFAAQSSTPLINGILDGDLNANFYRILNLGGLNGATITNIPITGLQSGGAGLGQTIVWNGSTWIAANISGGATNGIQQLNGLGTNTSLLNATIQAGGISGLNVGLTNANGFPLVDSNFVVTLSLNGTNLAQGIGTTISNNFQGSSAVLSNLTLNNAISNAVFLTNSTGAVLLTLTNTASSQIFGTNGYSFTNGAGSFARLTNGYVSISGIFSGNGSGLSALNGSSVASGTVVTNFLPSQMVTTNTLTNFFAVGSGINVSVVNSVMTLSVPGGGGGGNNYLQTQLGTNAAGVIYVIAGALFTNTAFNVLSNSGVSYLTGVANPNGTSVFTTTTGGFLNLSSGSGLTNTTSAKGMDGNGVATLQSLLVTNGISSLGLGVTSEQFGLSASAAGLNSTAFGRDSMALGTRDFASGYFATAVLGNSTALGAGAEATNGGVAVGNNAVANTNSVAIGNNSINGLFTNSIVIGANTTNTGNFQALLPNRVALWVVATNALVGSNGVPLILFPNQIPFTNDLIIGNGGQVLTTNGPYSPDPLTSTTNFAGQYNFFGGINAGLNNTSGSQNTFVGPQAGLENTTGDQNAFFGTFSGLFSTNGFHNTLLGAFSGYQIGNSTYCTYVGTDVGPQAVGTGASNTANVMVGNGNGYNMTTASFNDTLGSDAGQALTTGRQNVYIGNEAGKAAMTGNQNVIVGGEAMASGGPTNGNNVGVGYFVLSSASLNSSSEVAIGNFSLQSLTTGARNTFVGYQSGQSLTTGQHNTGVSYDAINANDVGNNNTALGYLSLLSMQGGSGNTAVGNQSGQSLTGTTSENTFFGDGADVDASVAGTLNHGTAIGSGAIVSANNSLVLGRSADTVIIPGSLTVTNRISATNTGGFTAMASNALWQVGTNGSFAYLTNGNLLLSGNLLLAGQAYFSNAPTFDGNLVTNLGKSASPASNSIFGVSTIAADTVGAVITNYVNSSVAGLGLNVSNEFQWGSVNLSNINAQIVVFGNSIKFSSGGIALAFGITNMSSTVYTTNGPGDAALPMFVGTNSGGRWLVNSNYMALTGTNGASITADNKGNITLSGPTQSIAYGPFGITNLAGGNLYLGPLGATTIDVNGHIAGSTGNGSGVTFDGALSVPGLVNTGSYVGNSGAFQVDSSGDILANTLFINSGKFTVNQNGTIFMTNVNDNNTGVILASRSSGASTLDFPSGGTEIFNIESGKLGGVGYFIINNEQSLNTEDLIITSVPGGVDLADTTANWQFDSGLHVDGGNLTNDNTIFTKTISMTTSPILPAPVSLSSGNQSADCSASETFVWVGSGALTLANMSNGENVSVAVTAGSGAVTFSASQTIKWPAAAQPAQTAGTDVYTFIRLGSVIYASAVQNY